MNANDNTNTPTIIKDLAAGLGALVWWDLEGTAILPDKLRAILTSEGEDASVVPDVDPIKGLKRAVGAWTMGRGNQDRFRAATSADTDDEVVVTILKFQKTAGDVAWLPIGHVSLNKHAVNSGLQWDGSGPVHAIQSFHKLATRYMTHLDHQWIRPNLIQNRLKQWSSFPLRKQGGVTFVPSNFLPGVEQLARIVGQIGDSALSVAHIQPTDASRGSISKSAQVSLKGELATLREQLDEWLAGTHKARPASVADAIDKFSELQKRAALYRDALSMTVDELTKEIEEAREAATELLGTRQTESPDAARKFSKRTLDKMEKAVLAGQNGDGTAIINAKLTEAAGLGKGMIGYRSRWLADGLYVRTFRTLGWIVESHNGDHVTLRRAA